MSFLNGVLLSAFSNLNFLGFQLSGGGGGGFDLGQFFKNLMEKGKEWGAWFIGFLGVILVIWGIVNVVKAFISQGRGQTNWLLTIGMILVGGFLIGIAGAWDNLQKFLDMGTATINDLGQTS